jgi:lipopolysaccharide assembly outer membrane protein LptD (OstA)
VEIFAGTAYITADEVEMHEQGPTIEARGSVKISILGVPRA